MMKTTWDYTRLAVVRFAGCPRFSIFLLVSLDIRGAHCWSREGQERWAPGLPLKEAQAQGPNKETLLRQSLGGLNASEKIRNSLPVRRSRALYPSRIRAFDRSA